MCMCRVTVIRMENRSGVPSSNYERELCINALGTDTNLPLGQTRLSCTVYEKENPEFVPLLLQLLYLT